MVGVVNGTAHNNTRQLIKDHNRLQYSCIQINMHNYNYTHIPVYYKLFEVEKFCGFHGLVVNRKTFLVK